LRHWLRPVAVIAAAWLLGLLLQRSSLYLGLRERAFDVLLSNARSTAALVRQPNIVVVDIDRQALEQFGPWPWGRDRLAGLIEQLAKAQPRLVGLDILLDGPDEQSPAALARRLAKTTSDGSVSRLAETLPDGDALLRSSMTAVPTVLGVALDPSGGPGGALGRPIIARGPFDASELWREPGHVGPSSELTNAAAGLGALAVAGDADGSVRRLPMLAVVGERLVPGFALEVIRVASEVPMLAVTDAPRSVMLAREQTTSAVRIDADGMLRLVPPRPETWGARTISAAAILTATQDVSSRLQGRIVLIGSSAPDTGGLRPVPSGELVPTVQLQADAIAQLMRGWVPLRPKALQTLESFGLALAALLGTVLGATRLPARGVIWVVGVAAAWIVASAGVHLSRHWLLDPLIVPGVVALAFVGASLLRAAETAQREQAVRQRFEQHLAPAVVRQIIDNPSALKLQGEVRVVTAFFTDVEGFTALTERAEPHQLIAVLDAYFDGVIRIVVEHGGLVDKIVGDAVHALFNAPFDLPDHAGQAVACGAAVQRFAMSFNQQGLALELGLGRTRIGIETGPAIVGDVGGARKLDYTAHGNPVNAAARLEAANKEFGTSILIGPGTTALLPEELLCPLGTYDIRGRREGQLIYTVWPDTLSDASRAQWRAAMAQSAEPSLADVRRLADMHPDVTVLRRLSDRLQLVSSRQTQGSLV
jgi:adenylate cyclase